MAKLVTVLGLEGTTLRGVGLVADGGRFSRAAEDSWPLVAAADLPGADGGDGEASQVCQFVLPQDPSRPRVYGLFRMSAP